MPEEIEKLNPDVIDFKQMIVKINEVIDVLNAYEISARIPTTRGRTAGPKPGPVDGEKT